MKLPLVLIALLLISSSSQAQSGFAGNWQGRIEAFNLRIVINIVEKDGSLSATMDSPDQGSRGIPCDKVTVNGNNITISVDVVKGSYTGILSADKKHISGKWNQGGGSYELLLGQDALPPPKPKMQTPRPPFQYASEEVEYDNADRTVHFGGTITYPTTGTKFPAAILISGSGQQDRNSDIMGHQPFAVIADRLTKMGFAVLRVDDRGVGKTTGDVRIASSADFAKDVITGIEYLKRRKEIDTTRIGLIGHSEGGLIALLVAAERKDIDFLVMLAGPGIKGSDLLAEQGAKLVASGGASEAAVNAYMPLYRKMIVLSASGLDSASINAGIRNEVQAWKNATDPLLVKEMGYGSKGSTEMILENLIPFFAAPWVQYFLASDPAPLIEKLSIKVLALNGSKDIQVVPESNIAGIKKALAKSRSPLYEVKVLSGLNHLFQYCFACGIDEYQVLEESFSEVALAEMAAWLKKNVLTK